MGIKARVLNILTCSTMDITGIPRLIVQLLTFAGTFTFEHICSLNILNFSVLSQSSLLFSVLFDKSFKSNQLVELYCQNF